MPAASAYAALGLSNLTIGAFPLPLDLSSYGLTGCLLWADAMFGAHWPTVPTGPGSAAFDFTIPNSSVLVGVTLFVQAWSPAPGVNPAGVVVSNGLEWQIGQQ